MDKQLKEAKAVYRAGEHVLSIRDLLLSFVDPDYQSGGISRISDFHFKVGRPVRYRFDGELEELEGGEPLTEEAFQELIFPLLRKDQKTRFTGGGEDIDGGFAWGKVGQNFRLNLFRDRDGPACVIRMLASEVPPLSQVGFPSDRTWKEITALKQGLVLVTGITGSGKTTTIASLLGEVNRTRKVRIITLEDPIEYQMESAYALISQREVGVHVRSFDAGLRSALRENPDIIFVGEIRDRESATLALSAAETGHLVFTTLHTKDARGAITRLIDIFPPERSREVATQVSFSIAYVLGQKLIPRADGQGRCVAMEVMRNVGALSNLIRLGKWEQLYSVIETHSKVGMNTMEQHLVELVETGVVDYEEALRHANDAKLLEQRFGPPVP